eukprot:maker-scaffold443_size169656-snap-gene-0.13 protein:Tk07430 transcript:maker-scaffold443_size169656-snap-gene-0.13-mRNA-1 annotation:"potassium voltage-gated channel protein eag isoform x1"
MPGGRRGLVAPQNTFLDNLIKKAGASPDTSFLLANAQIVDYPIVYCSEEFSKMLGYPRSDVMQKSIRCDFMVGVLTDQDTLNKITESMARMEGGAYEVLFYKKNGHAIWLQVDITEIRNAQRVVVLFLCAFRDITAFKEPLEGGSVTMSNLSKFAKLAWTMTRSRNGPNPTNKAMNNSRSSVNLITQVNTTQGQGVRTDLPRPAFLEFLPEYKHDPPKTPPHILLHYSTFKVVWDWVILGLTFYTVIMVPFNLAINRTFSNEDITLLVVDSIVDLIFFIDIIFNFHTSFVGTDGSVIVEETKIRHNYLRSGFAIDIMACLPYDALSMFDTSEDQSTYGNIFSILKVMRLFRLGRVARALHRFLESSFALLLLMLSFYMIVAHWFACIWYVIGKEDLRSGIQYGWLSTLANRTEDYFILLRDDRRNSTLILGGPPLKSIYITSLYFTMTCMTSIGFGNVAAETDSEKTFSVCMMMISSLLYAAIFGHVTTIIHNMTLATAKYHEMLNSVKEFMFLNEVPKNLCERVLDYVVSKWTNTKGVDQDRVLSVCPKDMRADICVHLNRRVFNGCPAFRLASDGCLRALAVNFDTMHCAPGDFIFRKGESIRELSFVVSGSLEVIQDGEILAFLSKGDVFGDAQWKEHQLAKSAVHVRALTYCDIHMINVEKLKDVLEFYKAFAQTFERNLTLTYDLSKRTVLFKVSDRKMEKVFNDVQQYEPPFTPAQVLLLKKAVNKFKGQINEGSPSGGSESGRRSASPRVLRERIINRLHGGAGKSHPNQIGILGDSSPPAQRPSTSKMMFADTDSIRSTAVKEIWQDKPRTLEAKNDFIAAKTSGGKKWKLMRQKSQQMMSVLSPTNETRISESSAALLNEFNEALNCYRGEIRTNLAQLDAKIGRLEA